MSDRDVTTVVRQDGSLEIRPSGTIGADQVVLLQQTLVHALRHTRPLRLILELRDVADLDPITVGTFAAACGLGDDHKVAVFLDNASATLADQLTAAGVPQQRLRQTAQPEPAD